MNRVELFKSIYGAEEIYWGGGVMVIPRWLCALLINNVGLKSKRARIQKKVVRREMHRLLIDFARRYNDFTK